MVYGRWFGSTQFDLGWRDDGPRAMFGYAGDSRELDRVSHPARMQEFAVVGRLIGYGAQEPVRRRIEAPFQHDARALGFRADRTELKILVEHLAASGMHHTRCRTELLVSCTGDVFPREIYQATVFLQECQERDNLRLGAGWGRHGCCRRDGGCWRIWSSGELKGGIARAQPEHEKSAESRKDLNTGFCGRVRAEQNPGVQEQQQPSGTHPKFFVHAKESAKRTSQWQ